ncbi:MAG: CrcB family protein [Bacteroidales bacterium]|nr:CrcB family protein [Bacteroidales bacterium]MBN2819336.1 CrcB family protein [Bacteroidales bacterium]
MQTVLLVFVGGGLGSLARFSMSKLVTAKLTGINPVATFFSNLLATLLLGGIVFFLSSRGNVTSSIKALIIIGFCGGFSTFSTFSFETFELIKTGNLMLAAINVVVSIIIGVGSLFILSKIIQ